MWSMIKGEFRHILHNRLLLLSVTVICFIPFLYSIFFLKSVWDPYGSTRNLPVAVVNKDIPVEYQGRKMDVGQQTVDELKKNHQLKWEFVSAKKAKYGMSHRKYYAVVTIPKDFSENAATVLQKHPRTMKLHYQTNGSLNYIGQVIVQTGMTRLNEKIRASVTNAYATAMFKQLHVLGKGMTKAADGAKQIDTGMVTLSDGVNRYVAGVSQVNNGVQTLRVSVAPLASGAQQLATGSQTLANGIMQYTGGVSLLGNGVGQLMANSGALNSGAGQLSSGLSTLMANSGALNSGAGQLNSGLNELMGNSGKLNSGANDLSNGLNTLRDKSSDLQNGSGQLASGANQLNSTVNSQLGNINFNGIMGAMDQAQSLQQGLGQLQTGLATAKNALAGVQDSAGKLQQASGSLSSVAGAGDQLKGVATNDAEIAGLAQQILKDDKASDSTKAAAQQIAGKAGSNVSTIQGLSGTLGQLSSLQGSLSGMQQQLSQLSQMSTVLNNADGTIKQANTLLATLNGYKGTLAAMPDAVNQLKNATSQISSGASTLNNGVNQYTNGVDSAAAGAGTLNSGIGRYTAGVAQAGAGAGQLANGISQYTAGVAQAGAGANQLANGIGQYTAGVGQLGSGISQLNANSGALNSGAGQLASALGQLNGQVPALVAGVNQLAAGTQQLQDNSPALISGISRLNAGASQLATSLEGGAKQVNGIKTSSRTAKMFAEPTALKHTDYSYVPNYGHALAPYVLSLAIYVGALVFNFVYPIRRVAEFGKAPIAWWASKVTVGSIVVTAMAIAEDAIMMACGLTVLHPVSFFVTTICFGLASMAIVMFLSMLFDNPGRFFAMVLLMLQLGGSGGTFPMEITMKFYNVIHWYLPMTYSILGLRDSISGGLGSHYVAFCNAVLLVIAVVFFILLLFGMIWLQHHHFAGRSELDNNQELLGPEGDYDGMHLQQKRPNQGNNGEQ
ncbi:YhgE/Pip domain-containing protein [Limosilactobacillus sp. RRLNB_1_1]|uniref:YhgE/Pip domain-containing protein n=1 Tax=Limosilactobacillus albertensis TaxID=2759752 RepID=A0A7W3TR84_9LACO|nr:YhgE/Pip domain-containing protein [Limosilactobacillus albertensis]MBB1069428.1 YhgE/Pip domain-containing protein [Limosilactobacillus albertensis]MCD7117954.1 YhgE/Pip domain-containing protein [Limosilactobacillus albertensis]MCD7127792.1 YhgE/Pip domain-containing protein [Limosilactobacillus albertensis]